MHKDDHYRKARATIENLKLSYPDRCLINIQGCIGAKVIASTSIKDLERMSQPNFMVRCDKKK